MKCARRVCQNEGVHPHKDIQKTQPDNCFYCTPCATDINAECRRFGDAEVFDLKPRSGMTVEEFCDHYQNDY